MKVAIYCRLSEEDRNKQFETDDSESIQNQKSMLLTYAIEHGWEVYNIYSDDDYTGSDRKRPEFNHLLQDAENHKFDIILCKTQSRFTRELELVEKYIHGLFPVWGIRFISIVDNADTANKGNKKSRQINGLVNEWYLEDMSDNIKSVLTNKRKQGIHIGAYALYGYVKDPKQKGHLIIDPEAANIVHEVFTMFVQGYGKSNIARILNDRGIPNPTEYKRRKGLRYAPPERKNSTLWSYSAISSMLKNEIYIGNMVQGKYGSVSYKTKQNKPRPREEWYIVEGTHEPIIEKDLWDTVQKLTEQRVKAFDIGTIGIFARKVKCAGCGYIMRSTKSRDRHYLKCSTRYASKNACTGAFISVDTLEKAVIAELNRLSKLYLDADELGEKIHLSTDFAYELKKLQENRDIYTKKIDEYTKGLHQLYLDKVKGIVSESDFVSISEAFHSETERLEQNIITIDKQAAEIREKKESADSREKIIRQYTNMEHLTREIVDKLIDYIVVSKRIKGTKEIPIEIHWNF